MSNLEAPAHDDFITCTECDTCGKKGPCSLFHLRGTPILGQCPECDPKAFERLMVEAPISYQMMVESQVRKALRASEAAMGAF